MKKYLIALPCFPGAKGFNHRTILVEEANEYKAYELAKYLKPNDNLGDIKQVTD
jgi:hypothetical protein